MSETNLVTFKNELKQFCREAIEKRITVAREAMQRAQEAANGEEKSSAGDKYETARAMGQLEKDMYARQMLEYTKELSALYAINTGIVYDTVQPGCFFQVATGRFFIAAGLGKHSVDGKTILFLSSSAPLAMALKGKKNGDSFVFNGTEETIFALY